MPNYGKMDELLKSVKVQINSTLNISLEDARKLVEGAKETFTDLSKAVYKKQWWENLELYGFDPSGRVSHAPKVPQREASLADPHALIRLNHALQNLGITVNTSVARGMVYAMMRTKDRTYTSQSIDISHEFFLGGPDVSNDDKIAMLRKQLIVLLTHELDEWLYVGGFGDDPHGVAFKTAHAKEL